MMGAADFGCRASYEPVAHIIINEIRARGITRYRKWHADDEIPAARFRAWISSITRYRTLSMKTSAGCPKGIAR